MRYEVDIELNLPIQRVVELFDSFENLKKWQPTLKEIIPISGNPGETGAETKLIYDDGKKKTEMVEKIISRDFPDDFSAYYEAKGVKNWVYNSFKEISSDKTQWIMDTEFRLQGFLKIFAFFMPGAFRKESLKSMMMFKEWAEKS